MPYFRPLSTLRPPLGLVLTVAIVAAPAAIQAIGGEPDPPAPRQVRLLDGRTIRLEAPNTGALVLVFYSTECPISNTYNPTLNAIVREFPTERFRLVGLCVDPDPDDAQLTEHAKEYGLTFPVARDVGLAVARGYRITVTPEVVVLDPAGRVRYRGRIDDQFKGRQEKNQNPATHELRDAIAAVLAGRDVTTREVTAVGCPLPEPAGAEARPVTYTRDVAAILGRNCQECHRSGNLGPFALDTYERARKRAADIAAVAEQRQMPPWRAAPGYGPKFKHDRSLSKQEIATLIAWAEAGAPQGDPADLPPPPKFPEGWSLGTPDVVIEMPEPFAIPASGGDIYRCFVIPNPLPEEAQIVGIEYQPGNPRVVHHILGYVDVSGEAEKKDQAEPGQGYTCFGGPMIRIHGDLGGWAPGANADLLPEGVGRILPKGSHIIMQIHYHPNGKPETDRSRIGLYLAPKGKPIKKAFHWWAASNPEFTGRKIAIEAGSSHFELQGSTLPLPVDVEIMAVSPHMHLLGKDMTMWAEPPKDQTFPDGSTRKELIRIDDWDFKWQLQYYLAEPIALPKGSVVRLVAHYDNSAGNPFNPNNPPKDVQYGEATTDEMCFGFFGMVKKDQDLTRPGEKDDLGAYLAQQFKELEEKARQQQQQQSQGRETSTGGR